MLKINIQQLKGIIYLLDDSTCFSNYDFSSLLHLGFEQRDIAVMLSIISQLRTAPYLDFCDFLEPRENQVINRLGGIHQIKQALDISDYTFEQFLSDNHSNSGRGTCLLYWMYLRFADDIRSKYIDSNHSLIPSLAVQLGDRLRLQSIPLPNGRRALIPTTAKEAALIGSQILAKHYQFKAYDDLNSLLSLQCLKDNRNVEVEVRCLASQLVHHEYDAFCVEDDLPRSSFIRKHRKIISFSQMILPLITR
ncbi:hypothetical protein [Vibrio furnissii]|uniref:hypothetical protein n=1 Tax=Vibrio furnissii TaxID=29494 RepID=UPI001EEA501E|nr:hypothetical protein [Vibrio furnissii]MCG6231510.1 hypothetical protein [Vibrio furnissii]MCG6261435.1 hypothetical protein [Vibrio furnissii]